MSDSDAAHGGVTGPFTGPHLLRGGRELLQIEPAAGGAGSRVQVRRFSLACPKEHVIVGRDPVQLWLSPLGHAYVVAGEPPDRLALQIHDDPSRPSLALGSERAYFSRTIDPELVGLAFTLDGRLVEIVDVQASDGTRFEERRWRTERAAPAVHVQLKVSPAPPS